MLWPVIQPPAALARNATTPAMSSGCPTRPSAMVLARTWLAAGSLAEAFISGRGGARTDGIDRDTARTEMNRQQPTQDVDRGLGRSIDRHRRIGRARHHRRQIDDAAAIIEMRQQRLDQEKRRLEVDLKHPVEIGFRHLIDGLAFIDTGVVDQYIERRLRRMRCKPGQKSRRQVAASRSGGKIGLDDEAVASVVADRGQRFARLRSLRCRNARRWWRPRAPARSRSIVRYRGWHRSRVRSCRRAASSRRRHQRDQPWFASSDRARAIRDCRSTLLVPAHGRSVTNSIRRGCW